MPRHNKTNLSAIFGRFAGQEIEFTETPYKRELKSIGQTIEGVTIQPANSDDPVLKDMRKTAEAHGLSLRLWWPGLMGTMDFRGDRVNAHIEKEADGKYRIQPHFSIG